MSALAARWLPCPALLSSRSEAVQRASTQTCEAQKSVVRDSAFASVYSEFFLKQCYPKKLEHFSSEIRWNWGFLGYIVSCFVIYVVNRACGLIPSKFDVRFENTLFILLLSNNWVLIGRKLFQIRICKWAFLRRKIWKHLHCTLCFASQVVWWRNLPQDVSTYLLTFASTASKALSSRLWALEPPRMNWHLW